MLEQNKKLVEIDLKDVLPNRFQPRINFDESKIIELSESIRKYGVIQPIIVRKNNEKYEIIAGERRYKASKLANKTTIPAIVISLTDKESIEIALLENIQRENLTPIEEAVSYKRIIDMGYITQNQLADKLGKSQSFIANKIRLLKLPDEVQEALMQKKISERHARSLLKLKNDDNQINMLKRIIEERLTVRKTDEEINKLKKPESKSEIEILEFNDEVINSNKELNKLEKKGEKNMNNNENNPSPFPTLNQINNNVEPQNNEEPFVGYDNNNQTNPGFVDVNQIMNNAQDIAAPKENDNRQFMPDPQLIEQNNNIIEQQKTDELKNPTLEEASNENPPISNGQFFGSVSTDKSSEDTVPLNQPTVEPSQTYNNVFNPTVDLIKTVNNSEVIPNNLASSSPISDSANSIPTDLEQPNAVGNNSDIFSNLTQSTPAENNVSTPNISSNINPEALTVPTKDIQNVISLAQEYMKKIQDLGFSVSKEELDMPTQYQITIKIEK